MKARGAASADAEVKQQLAAGTPVSIKRNEGTWALIERNGAEIGYVPIDALLKIQN